MESSDLTIQAIRLLGLPRDFVKTLQRVLTAYKQPTLEQIQQLDTKDAFAEFLDRPCLLWRYSKIEDEFIFIPMDDVNAQKAAIDRLGLK